VENYLRDALTLLLKVVAPALGVTFAVCLVLAVVQAVAHVRDRTLANVPRLLAVLFVAGATGAYMGQRLLAFLQRALEVLPSLRG
jgi:flagellar biosynthesis protein FliQ